MPARTESGLPESVPAWYTAPAGASRSIEFGPPSDRSNRVSTANDFAQHD